MILTGETEVPCSSATNCTWTGLKSKPNLRGEELVTSRLSCGEGARYDSIGLLFRYGFLFTDYKSNI